MPTSTSQVLVVGAGPVGLTMAAELARHGVPCRIVDQLATPLPYCRAIGVTPRTLEVWDDMGIVTPMIDAGLWIDRTRRYLNHSPAQDTVRDFSDLPYSSLGIPQPETERILTAHLATFGIEIERPVSLTSFTQNGEGVDVELQHSDGTIEKATFQYIIGCDGARSAVRRILDIPFEGDHYPVGFMLGDVVLNIDLPRATSLWAINTSEQGPPDFFIAIPLPARNRYRVSMLAPPDSSDIAAPTHGLQTDRPAPTLEQLQVVADRVLPIKAVMSDLQWSSNFRIGMRLAANYRKGRGFLAGDAAHIHPPTGGQGMNTGIQDAYNLAWKMALVLRGKAAPSLLDTYEAERRPVGADVVARTRAASDQLGRKDAPQQDRLADTQVLIHYRDSTLSKNDSTESLQNLPIQAGDRAPDCDGLHRENVRAPFRLLDITRGTPHTLLVYLGQSITPELAADLEHLAETFKAQPGPACRITAIAAANSTLPTLIGVPIITDTAGQFAATYKPTAATAYLVRPDGYIGYHARPITQQGIINYLAAFAT
jgi:2-polyprenyl-6-methoxyphenol hydroxylase-like FAD-dependent oxidoreductase